MVITATQLCGVWNGISISKKNDATKWTDTALVFLPVNSTTYEIKGKGVSLWRGMSIDFTVTGTYSCNEGRFTLTKCHSGKYTNQVQYSGNIKEKVKDEEDDDYDDDDDDDADDDNLTFQMFGEYNTGKCFFYFFGIGFERYFRSIS